MVVHCSIGNPNSDRIIENLENIVKVTIPSGLISFGRAERDMLSCHCHPYLSREDHNSGTRNSYVLPAYRERQWETAIWKRGQYQCLYIVFLKGGGLEKNLHTVPKSGVSDEPALMCRIR